MFEALQQVKAYLMIRTVDNSVIETALRHNSYVIATLGPQEEVHEVIRFGRFSEVVKALKSYFSKLPVVVGVPNIFPQEEMIGLSIVDHRELDPADCDRLRISGIEYILDHS